MFTKVKFNITSVLLIGLAVGLLGASEVSFVWQSTGAQSPCPILALTGHGEVTNASTSLRNFFSSRSQFSLTIERYATDVTLVRDSFRALLVSKPGWNSGSNFSEDELGILWNYVSGGGTLFVAADADGSARAGGGQSTSGYYAALYVKTLLGHFDTDGDFDLVTSFSSYTALPTGAGPFAVSSFETNDDAFLETYDSQWIVMARGTGEENSTGDPTGKPALAIRNHGQGKVYFGAGELGAPDYVSDSSPHLQILENILNEACQ